MNRFDNVTIDEKSFSFRDLLSQDRWNSFTPAFTSLTTVGTLSASGRYRFVGRQCFFEVQFSAGTSIASTAGTTHMSAPVTTKGIAGHATMTNDTTKIATGTCHVDTTNSKIYLPAQTASGNTFTIAGWCEIG